MEEGQPQNTVLYVSPLYEWMQKWNTKLWRKSSDWHCEMYLFDVEGLEKSSSYNSVGAASQCNWDE